MQIVKKEESEMDTLLDELQRHMDHNDCMTHQRSIEGHDHQPFSLMQWIVIDGILIIRQANGS